MFCFELETKPLIIPQNANWAPGHFCPAGLGSNRLVPSRDAVTRPPQRREACLRLQSLRGLPGATVMEPSTDGAGVGGSGEQAEGRRGNDR